MKSNRKNKNYLLIGVIAFLTLLSVPTTAFAMKISDGTTVGGVEIEGQSTDEARERIEELVETWKGGPPIIASNEYETIEIPRGIVNFDLDNTFLQLEEKMERHWSNFFQKSKNVKQELIVELKDDIKSFIDLPEHVDADQTLSYVLLQAKHLTNQSVTLEYVEGFDRKKEEVSSIILGIDDLSIPPIEYMVDELDGKLIGTNTLFSFLEQVALPTAIEGAEDELSFLASGLYSLALETNMEILERHAQKNIPTYTEAGLEAQVNRNEELDLKIYHEEHFSYEIQAELRDNEVVFTLLAPVTEGEVSYSIENMQEIETRTIYRYNPDLEPGDEAVIQAGRNGLHLEVYRIHESQKDMDADTELISQDFYAPIHRIIETSVQEQREEEDVSGEGEETESPSSYQQMIEKLQPNPENSEDCEEDSNLCENKDLDFQTILSACTQETDMDTETDEEEITEETEEKGLQERFCNVFILLFLLEMFNNEDYFATFLEVYLSAEDDLLDDWQEKEEEVGQEEEEVQ